jgi:hypothetical protein
MAFGSPLRPPTTNRVGRQPEMADREKELVREVQRLRRERNRVRDEHDREARKRQRMKAQNKLADQAGEPRPFTPDDVAAQTRLVKTLSQRADAVDAELERAERKLERFRAALTPKQRLAKKILESPHSRFVFSSPTGGTAKAGFEAIAAGRKAPVAATGVPTNVQESLLRGLAAMDDAGVILINCLTNGKHVDNSNHYKGKAVDLDLNSPLGSTAIEAIARQHGGRRNFRSTHIHIDFL